MLDALGTPGSELSVLLTNDEKIRALNHEHRGKNRPTDVLAFPQGEAVGGATPMLGDVVISLDTAERQARGRGRDLLEEVRLLLAHGLLHLVGHDHSEPTEARQMRRETRRLVAWTKKNTAQSSGGAKPRGALPRPRRAPRKHR